MLNILARKKSTNWLKLDNAAKIFPPTSGKKDTKVFRFACELFEPVKKEILELALEKTLKFFPVYRSVLKRGMFWYYLENTSIEPKVKEENAPPCGILYDKNVKSLLFEVTYYNKRINLEVYHAITDGTGAIEFLRELVCRYLAISHADEIGEYHNVSAFSASLSEKMADSFQKYYDASNTKAKKSPRAYKVKLPKIPENRIKIIEGLMPVDKLLEIAREKKTTITILLVSILLMSIHEGMSLKDKKKPVNISVPANLRKYFASESVRNFFVVTSVSYDFLNNSAKLDDIIPFVADKFKENLTQENLACKMNSLISIEKNFAARAVPLALKNLFMRAAYEIAALNETGALSNLGNISVPQEYEKYIRLFDVFSSSRRPQTCICSYKNNMIVTFSDPFVSSDIQKKFFRTLAEMGIPIEITSNPMENRGEWER